MQLSHF